MIDWSQYYSQPEKGYSLLSISFVVLVTPFLMKLASKCKLSVPYKCVVTIVTLISVIILYITGQLKINKTLTTPVNPRLLLTLLHPIMILKVTFDIDMESFKRILPLVIILATLGVMLQVCVLGGVIFIWTLKAKKFGIILAAAFGFALASIDDNETLRNLREYENLRLVYTLIQGECILGNAVCLLGLDISLSVLNGLIGYWYEVLYAVFYSIVIAIIFGAVMGKLFSFCITQMFGEPLHVSIFTLAGVYSTYYISENFLKVSSPLATFTMTTIIVTNLSALSETTYNLLNNAVYFLNDSILLVIINRVTVSLLLRSAEQLEVMLILEYAAVYIFGLLARFVTVLFVSPILIKTGHGIKFKSLIFLFWTAKKSVLQLLFYMIIYHHKLANAVMRHFGVHVYVYVVLTYLINGLSEGLVLRVFGLIGLSAEKVANMGLCLKHIYLRKQNFISAMKIYRNVLFVDWEIVEAFTKLDNLRVTSDNEQVQETRTRVYFCGDCKKEIILPPTKKELQRMTLIAKNRCVELTKISIIRQAERGIIADESKMLLLNLLDKEKESESRTLDVQSWVKVYKKNDCTERIQLILESFHLEPDYPAPRTRFRRLCYKMTNNKYYECIFFIYLASAYISAYMTKYYYLLSDSITTLVIIIHVFLKIQSYSHIYLKEGIKLYVKCYWNITDLLLLMSSILDIGGDILLPQIRESIDVFSGAKACAFRVLWTLRIMRLIKIISIIYPFKKEILKFCDTRISVRIGNGIDMSQGLVNSFDEMLHMMPTIVENETVRAELTEKFKVDKKVLIGYINEVQRNRNWIAVTVKTKRAIRRSLFSMRLKLLDLQNKGLLEHAEFGKLMMAHARCKKISLSIKRVPLNTPEKIFKELPWLYDQQDFSDMFYSFGIPMKWKAKESICAEGFVVPGLYVIVEGMVILNYNPANIEELASMGALPCKDYINDIDFTSPATLILIPGNTFGEISVMTRRTNHCTAIAEMTTTGYFIPIFLISQILSIRQNLKATGLYSSIWKYIAQNLNNWLLWKTPIFSHMLRDDANIYFRKGFVPDLTNCNFFVATDLIEDIVLIEGKVEDLDTGEVYFGPRYLRRSSVHLLLILENGITPILFIQPLKDEYAERIMTSIAISSVIAVKTLERRHTIKKSVTRSDIKLKSFRDSTELIPKGKPEMLPRNSETEELSDLSHKSSEEIKSIRSTPMKAKGMKNNAANLLAVDDDDLEGMIIPDIEWISQENLHEGSSQNTTQEIPTLESFNRKQGLGFKESADSKKRTNKYIRNDSSQQFLKVIEKILQGNERSIEVTDEEKKNNSGVKKIKEQIDIERGKNPEM